MERTPSQTVGPFFHEALRWRDGHRAAFSEPGEDVVLVGRMFDGAGAPVGDALVETWQRSPKGETPAGAETGNPYGFARVETRKDGTFRIETRMPGGTAPCLDVTIVARGLLKPLRTRVYLAPEAAVRADPAMKPIASSPRLKTLLATREAGEFRWDVRLQGDGETVFFSA
jgi:protocatechuate 3,4-dioxygenase alpha subunit